ncbi:GGDEF domain-containing protein [Escherichia coli]|nr:GGDEF domain-containing protein [Escherichia coli]
MKDLLVQDLNKDPLTNVYNRRYLSIIYNKLKDEVNNIYPITVMMLDIDHFKKINDEFGHNSGDAVLVSLASVLVSNLNPQGVVIRTGGEEFFILLPGVNQGMAVKVADNLMNIIRGLPLINGMHKISVSIGIYSTVDFSYLTDCMAKADEALYKAKKAGRDRTCIFYE